MTALYAAPLEGITNMLYRQVHHRLYPGVDKYFIPFISPTEHLTFSTREMREIEPSENEGLFAVPQILTRNTSHFVRMAQMLKDSGYPEVNLNLGCPSGTVTGKGKGSGMLRDIGALRLFLDEIFEKCPLPVSVKTRIGFEDEAEWEKLLPVYRQYPIAELIVHMRTRKEFYDGAPHEALSRETLDGKPWPFIYNGDLFTAAACRAYLQAYPCADGLMLGRGLSANPALIREIRGGEAVTREEIIRFHNALIDAYEARWPEKAVLGHMHETDTYLSACFDDTDKAKKAMRKAKNMTDYKQASLRLFETCPMKETPGFSLSCYR